MAVINCTPHTINLVYNLGGAEVQVSFEPSGRVIRIKAETEVEPMLSLKAGYPVMKSVYGEVQDAPEPNGDIFIVSTMVAQACPDRYDFVSPDTGPTAIRDNGQVKAVRGFQSFGIPWHKEARPMRDYQDGLGGL